MHSQVSAKLYSACRRQLSSLHRLWAEGGGSHAHGLCFGLQEAAAPARSPQRCSSSPGSSTCRGGAGFRPAATSAGSHAGVQGHSAKSWGLCSSTLLTTSQPCLLMAQPLGTAFTAEVVVLMTCVACRQLQSTARPRPRQGRPPIQSLRWPCPSCPSSAAQPGAGSSMMPHLQTCRWALSPCSLGSSCAEHTTQRAPLIRHCLPLLLQAMRNSGPLSKDRPLALHRLLVKI